ncbi:MAG: CapA family protein [Bacteroides sp.]
MNHFVTVALLLLSFSCTSVSQEKRDAAMSASDTLSVHRLTLLFAGDLMQHQGQIDAARTSNGTFDYTDNFKLLKEEISQADIAIGNLEVTLAGRPYSGYPAFSAPDEYLSAIQAAGFDVLITANNHCLDRRKRGLERTIHLLDSLRIPTAGTYVNRDERNKRYPLLLEKNNFRIALLNYTYATNGIPVTAPNVVNYIDRTVMTKDIQAAKALQPDAIIACMHWGVEYQSLPNKEQKELADWLLQQGVTHIIGSHPHVVQPMELRTDSLTGTQHVVVYSLGNFLSNMSARRTDGGLLFKLELTKDSITRVGRSEYALVWTGRPKLTQKKNFTLYPIHASNFSLPAEARNRLGIFTKDARSLFLKQNKEIKEYLIPQKNE